MIRIEFETSNAAFEEDMEGEVYRILCSFGREALAGKWDPGSKRLVRDINGNSIGTATWEVDK